MEKFDMFVGCEEDFDAMAAAQFEEMVQGMEEDFFAAELAKAERDADFVSNADA